MSDIVRTFVEGFDLEIGGGIPAGHVVLLSGTPGTMKSSFALNLLYNNMKHADNNCLYISLEESRDSLERMMVKLGMEERDEKRLFIVDMGKLRLDYLEEDEMNMNWLDMIKNHIMRKVQDDGVNLIVLDSLTALYSLAEFENPRQTLFHFFGFLKGLGATIFLISEMPYGSGMAYEYGEDFLADGNFLLKLHDVGETDVQLRIRCVKMRHADHHRGYFALMHRGNRFMVTSVISE